MRPTSRPGAAVLLSAALAAAQSPDPAPAPAPAAETSARTLAGEWTPDEAFAWSVLHDLADDLRRRGPRAVPIDRGLALAGFAARRFVADGAAWTDNPPNSRIDSWVVYLGPARGGDAPSFAFCLVSDGGLLVSPNRDGCAGLDFTPEAATGHGSRGRFADLLPLSGKGADGQMWETRETLPLKTLNVVVRNERDELLPHYRVLLAPQSWLVPHHGIQLRDGCQPLARPAPAGTVVTDRLGAARIDGIEARGLFACAGRENAMITLRPDEVRWDGSRLVLVVSQKAQALAAIAPNESAAIATLRNIASAQAQCQASGAIDVDQDGVGEYGCFGELTGQMPLRGPPGAAVVARMTPPVLSAAFGKQTDGVVHRSGYCFRLFLPGTAPGGADDARTEAPTGGLAGIAVDANRAEQAWCCYAWPIVAGESGRRVFFVDQHGDVTAAGNEDGRYSGPKKAPAADAARGPEGKGTMEAAPAANVAGRDGQRWNVVN